jgi:hypothetical protein
LIRVHLGAGRIEHELLVDPGIERRRDGRQWQLLRQRADQAARHEGDASASGFRVCAKRRSPE